MTLEVFGRRSVAYAAYSVASNEAFGSSLLSARSSRAAVTIFCRRLKQRERALASCASARLRISGERDRDRLLRLLDAAVNQALPKLFGDERHHGCSSRSIAS